MRLVCVFLIFAVFSAVFFSGCGGSNSSQEAKITGIVTGSPTRSTEVRVYSAGHAGEAQYLIASITGIQQDRSFELYVDEGTYDIDVGYPRYHADGGEMTSFWEHKILENVVVTLPVTDIGTIALPDPTP